jgi:iron complex outermembrane receptor protein
MKTNSKYANSGASARYRFSKRSMLMAATIMACTAPAFAQDDAVDGEEAKVASDIVVTGSRIRGIAPTGSAVIGMDRKDMDRLPVATTTDILRQIPMMTGLGADEGTNSAGSAVQGASFNNTQARAANLRGLGTTATLVLVDGHRIAPQGVSGQISDLDVIPALALERVEVVADGASAIYGSDAVAGVVNLILRKRWDGIRTIARQSFAADYRQTMASISGGKTWEGGSITATYEYSYRSRLAAADRPELYSHDLSAYGGGAPSTLSYPGNILIGGKSYAIPSGQNGSNLTLADLGPAGSANRLDPWSYRDALPQQTRHTGVIYAEQKVSDTVKLFLEGIYSKRVYDMKQGGTTSAATGYAVPSTNPYSPCAPGKSTANTLGIACPANGVVNVQYNFANDLRSYGHGPSELWSVRAGTDIDIGQWKASVATGYSRAAESADTYNLTNTAAITAALSGTGAVPALNLFCGNVLTCNSKETLDSIRAQSILPAKNELTYISVGLDGPLFQLPGGAVRLAVGTDLRWHELTNNNVRNETTANNRLFSENPTNGKRNIEAFYGELFVPIFGADNARPGAERLSLSVAVRTERYSDFGRTTNPKFGLTWEPVAGLNIRGSFGKSFRAPTLADIDPSTAAVYRALALTAGEATSLGLGNISTLSYIRTTGGTVGLQPEKATTWSLGFDYKPHAIPGLMVMLNYYNARYTNRIDQPVQNVGSTIALQSSPIYDDFIAYNPLFFPAKATMSVAEFNAAVQSVYDSTAPAFTGSKPTLDTIVAWTKGNKFNAGALKTSGIDFGTSYSFDTGMGNWRLGASGTYVIRYLNQITPGAVAVDLTNYYNAVGAPLRFKARGDIGWSNDNWSVSTYYNYTNGYNLTRAQLPAAADDKYLKIRSRLTIDATVNYRFSNDGGLLKDVALQANVQNLLNDDPPFMINQGASQVLFDPSNASPIGRMVSLQITKAF